MSIHMQERDTILQEIRTAVRHMAVYGVCGILVKAVGFFMLPFYTHYLSPADYGTLEILDLSMSVFGLVLNMGLVPAFLRCYAAVDGEDAKRLVVSTGCVFALVTGILTFLAGVGFVRPVSVLLFGPATPAAYVLLSFSALILSYMANLPRTYLRALEASGTYTAVDTLYVVLLLGLNIYFIAVLRVGLVGMLWSSFIAGVIQFVGLAGWAFGKVGFRFCAAHLKKMIDFGAPLILSNLALFVLNFSDRFFLQHLRSLDAVGIYAVGYKFGYMLNYLVVQPFFVMWQSRMYAIHAQPEHRAIFRQFFSMFSLGMIYVGLAMSLFSSEVVSVMVEPKFSASQNVIPIVVLAYIFYGLSYYAQVGMFLTAKTRSLGAIGVVTAALNMALNYVLISYWGMMGAAWATVLSFAFLTAASHLSSQRVFRLPLGFGRVTAGMMLAIAMYMLCRWWTPDPWGAGLVLKFGALAVFPVVVWKSGILIPVAAARATSASAAPSYTPYAHGDVASAGE